MCELTHLLSNAGMVKTNADIEPDDKRENIFIHPIYLILCYDDPNEKKITFRLKLSIKFGSNLSEMCVKC